MRHCGHQPPKPTCGVCRRYDSDPAFRAFSDRTAERLAATAPPEVPACSLVGRELTGPERAARGLDHARRWTLCLHKEQPLGEAVCGCKGCGPACPGYAPPEHEVRGRGWSTRPDVQRRHRLAADQFAANVPEYPSGTYSGRGVVVVGGGDYWPSAYVTCRMLRHVGCTLPVQVWFLGDRERDDRYADLLAPHGVECVDLLAHPAAASCRSLTGHTDPERPGKKHPPYEAKSFAALHSPFAEVLLLDADCYPCADPTPLYDCPLFRARGGTFWPDLPHTDKWTHWQQFGVEPMPPGWGWEVGQYLIDKRSAWRQLQLARWYDDHGDWCYGRGRYGDHGDKGSWRVAWAHERKVPAFYQSAAVWQRVAFVHSGPDGATPMFVHRCQSKFSTGDPVGVNATPQRGANVRAGLPGESAAFGYLAELRVS